MTTNGFEFRGGTVALIGACPGEAALLTERATRLISTAEVVLYDHEVGGSIMDLCRSDATLYFVGELRDGSRTPQSEVDCQLVHYARMGLRVVCLRGETEFNNLLGGEEVAALVNNAIEFAVVSGVPTSAPRNQRRKTKKAPAANQAPGLLRVSNDA